jgi:hypothetical protein
MYTTMRFDEHTMKRDLIDFVGEKLKYDDIIDIISF